MEDEIKTKPLFTAIINNVLQAHGISNNYDSLEHSQRLDVVFRAVFIYRMEMYFYEKSLAIRQMDYSGLITGLNLVRLTLANEGLIGLAGPLTKIEAALAAYDCVMRYSYEIPYSYRCVMSGHNQHRSALAEHLDDEWDVGLAIKMLD